MGPRWSAIAIAFGVTYLLNFVLNRRFAFTLSDPPPGLIRRQLVRFLPQLALDLVLTLTSVDLLIAVGLPLPVPRARRQQQPSRQLHRPPLVDLPGTGSPASTAESSSFLAFVDGT